MSGYLPFPVHNSDSIYMMHHGLHHNFYIGWLKTLLLVCLKIQKEFGPITSLAKLPCPNVKWQKIFLNTYRFIEVASKGQHFLVHINNFLGKRLLKNYIIRKSVDNSKGLIPY